MKRLAGLLLLWMLVGTAAASSLIQIDQLQFTTDAQGSRMTLHADGPLQYKSFTLANPERLVIDISGARLNASTKNVDFGGSEIRNIRSATRDGHVLRIVLDLTGKVESHVRLSVPNNGLLIELNPRTVMAKTVPRAEPAPAVAEVVVPKVIAPKPSAGDSLRDVVIAIDPGHGGVDPGATGLGGTHEKDVVLGIGRKLAGLIQSESGMQVVMTRSGDYFVPLRERVNKAREAKADLFVSIHADAVANREVKGSSVYVLSEHGASSEMARLLAQKENEADLIGGVSLDNKDPVLKTVLLDLSQTATIEESLAAGDEVLHRLCGVSNIHRQGVEQAGFMVLKAPDIPSMLVETAYISNPDEERKLVSEEFQQKVASAILSGIKDYFRQHAPPGSKLAADAGRRHIVAKGETLSTIAGKYGVSVDRLRVANNLSRDTVYVGGILRIPPANGT